MFELTLPRNAQSNIGHVDVKFSLHALCPELPTVQVTLLKQNITGLSQRSHVTSHLHPLTPVDEKIEFHLGNSERKTENPVISEEYQRLQNVEVICGPINLHRCTDLSEKSGCVTLTSPKLFRTKAKTLLVHIKALPESTSKDGVSLLFLF